MYTYAFTFQVYEYREVLIIIDDSNGMRDSENGTWSADVWTQAVTDAKLIKGALLNKAASFPVSRQEESSRYSPLEEEKKKRAEEAARVEKQAQIRAEEERKKREEEERKAYLESLSPEERDIEMIKEPSVSEQQVVEIYRKIDEFYKANKKKLAEALKDYWIQHNKWKGKLSHKQKQKVAKIKEILEAE